MKKNQVFADEKAIKPLTEKELQNRAGAWFTLDRIAGEHCDCGEGRGEFVLLPETDPVVVEGGKDYMKCRVCGGYSHL